MVKINKVNSVVAIAATFLVAVPVTQATQVFDSFPIAQVAKAIESKSIDTTIHAAQYTIDSTYAFGANEGDSTRANNKFIILHDVGTESDARANASYFKNNWSTAQTYTQYTVGNGGHVFKIGEPGYRAWGAGSYANSNSPVQIELGHTSTYEQFKQDYASYVALAHDSAVQFGIPLRFNNVNGGIITHQFVSQNFWGDHQDPTAYLAKWGVSQSMLANDVVSGQSSLGGSSSASAAPSQSAPATSQPSQSTNSNQYWYDDNGTQVTLEDGYFTPYSTMHDRAYPAGFLTSYDTMPGGTRIHYFGYAIKNGTVWIAYHGNDGYVHYEADKDIASGNFYGKLE